MRGPRGVRGRTGPQGPAGAGISGTEIVSVRSANSTADAKSATATCPAGTFLTGGGFTDNLLDERLTLSRSFPHGSAWTVSMHEINGVPANVLWEVTAYAVCAS